MTTLTQDRCPANPRFPGAGAVTWMSGSHQPPSLWRAGRGRRVTLAEAVPQRKQESRKQELVPSVEHTSPVNPVSPATLGRVQGRNENTRSVIRLLLVIS